MRQFSDSYVLRVLFAIPPPPCSSDAAAQRRRQLAAFLFDPYQPRLYRNGEKSRPQSHLDAIAVEGTNLDSSMRPAHLCVQGKPNEE